MRKNFFPILICISVLFWSFPLFAKHETLDRAINIVNRSKQKIEQSGEIVKKTTDEFGKSFAEKVGEIQYLIDVKKDLERKGELDHLTRRVIDGYILLKIGELKESTDKHLPSLLSALDHFDRTVSGVVIDILDTGYINANYKLDYKQLLEREKRHFNKAYNEAEELLQKCDDGDQNACERYRRVRMKLERMRQRKTLYDMRIRVAILNQKITERIRDTIKEEGGGIGAKFRNSLSKLYLAYSKVTPLVHFWEQAGALSIPTLTKLSENLEILDLSIGKLVDVVDGIVEGVLKDLGKIGPVPPAPGGKSINTQEELKRLNELKVDMETNVIGGEER